MRRLLWLTLLLWLGQGVPGRADQTLQLLLVNPHGSSIAISARELQAKVARKSHGHLLLEVHTDGQWRGHNLAELAIAQAVRQGDVDMAIVNSSPLGNSDTAFQLLDTPFLFDTYQQVDAALDGATGRALLRTLPRYGLDGLAIWDTGFRVLALRRPWHGPQDFHGLRIRVMESPMYQTVMKLFGAIPIPSGIDQVHAMLKSGYVDAVDIAYPTFFEYHMDDVSRVILETRHSYAAKVVLINDNVYRTLSSSEQGWLREAAEELRQPERKRFRAEEEATRARCKARGIVVQALTAVQRRQLKEACKPVLEGLRQQLQEPWEQALLSGD